MFICVTLQYAVSGYSTIDPLLARNIHDIDNPKNSICNAFYQRVLTCRRLKECTGWTKINPYLERCTQVQNMAHTEAFQINVSKGSYTKHRK